MGPTRMWCCAAAMHRNSRLPNARSRTCWSGCGGHNRGAADGVLRRVGGFLGIDAGEETAVDDALPHLLAFAARGGDLYFRFFPEIGVPLWGKPPEPHQVSPGAH